MAKEWWFNNVLMNRNEDANTKYKRRKISVDDHYRVAANFTDWEGMMRNVAEV